MTFAPSAPLFWKAFWLFHFTATHRHNSTAIILAGTEWLCSLSLLSTCLAFWVATISSQGIGGVQAFRRSLSPKEPERVSVQRAVAVLRSSTYSRCLGPLDQHPQGWIETPRLIGDSMLTWLIHSKLQQNRKRLAGTLLEATFPMLAVGTSFLEIPCTKVILNNPTFNEILDWCSIGTWTIERDQTDESLVLFVPNELRF